MGTSSQDVLVIIGEKVKDLRTNHNLSQKELAERLGVKQTIVAYWEKGEREIKATTVAEICSMFNVTPNYLMGYEDSLVIMENEILRFSKYDAEVVKTIVQNKDFMKFMKDNSDEKLNDLMKLWNQVSGILLK